MKVMKWEDIAPQLRTGDIVLFHGTTPVSIAIERLTHDRWSHVGMVVHEEGQPRPLIWQSTPRLGAKGLLMHSHHDGPQIDFLEDAFWTYDSPTKLGTFAIRRLEVEHTPEMKQALHTFIGEMVGTHFPTDLRMAWDWVRGLFGHGPRSKKKMFCAELVAASYQRMGLLADDLHPNAFAPKDFISGGKVDGKLLEGVKLGEEIEVQMTAGAPAKPDKPTVAVAG